MLGNAGSGIAQHARIRAFFHKEYEHMKIAFDVDVLAKQMSINDMVIR